MDNLEETVLKRNAKENNKLEEASEKEIDVVLETFN